DNIKMDVAVLVSGGKDSIFTTWLALHQYNIKSLITILSIKDSTLYQYQERMFVEALADAISIPIKILEISSEKDELILLEDALKNLNVNAFLVGGLLSEYQRFKFNSVGLHLGIPCFAPLWRKNQKELLEELVRHGFKIILSLVAGLGFMEDDLGKILTYDTIKRLENLNTKYGISIGGEGGEYETLVLNAPFYEKEIIIEAYYKRFDTIRSQGEIVYSSLKTK
ncbi:MAG: diphthine--ammonia ligase, partial [Candidatus Thorarchaeota archaeon]